MLRTAYGACDLFQRLERGALLHCLRRISSSGGAPHMLKLPARATLLAALLLALPLAAPATNANTEPRFKDSQVKHMGQGEVRIALGLAKASLAERGIHRPTPEQVKRELEGILK